MLRDADIAMCRAKAQGASGCEVFDTEMHALVVKRLKLETELRKAIELEELRVFYQPIVRLSTGKIAGVEALCAGGTTNPNWSALETLSKSRKRRD